MKKFGALIVALATLNGAVLTGCATTQQEMKYDEFSGEFVRTPEKSRNDQMTRKAWGALTYAALITTIFATTGQLHLNSWDYGNFFQRDCIRKSWYRPCEGGYNYGEFGE